MPKLYSMMKNDPSSFPRPNMTMREIVDFVRDHSDKIALEEMIVTGPDKGTELTLTKANYAKLATRHRLSIYSWAGKINGLVEHYERAFAAGRVDPNVIFCPVEG